MRVMMRWISIFKIAMVLLIALVALEVWRGQNDLLKERPELIATSGASSTAIGWVALLAIATFAALMWLAVRVTHLEKDLEKRNRDNPN